MKLSEIFSMKEEGSRFFRILSLALGMGMTACSGSKDDASGRGASELAAENLSFQHTIKVESLSEPVWYEAVGTSLPVRHATITARVTGQVAHVFQNEGAVLQEATTILELDHRDILARVSQAESALTAAMAVFEEARMNLERTKTLKEKSAATESMWEAANSAFLQAEAGVEIAENRLSEVRTQLSFSQVMTPFPGVLARRFVEPGDMAWPGKPLAEVYDPSEMELEIRFPERLKDLASVGTSLRLAVPSLKWEAEGLISEAEPIVDPVSRTFSVKAELPKDAKMTSGLFAKAWLKVGDREVLRSPEEAVIRVGQLPMLWVQIAGEGERAKWERRWVTLGRVESGKVEVLTGLNPGEVIGWSSAKN